jgi:competence protein ComEA
MIRTMTLLLLAIVASAGALHAQDGSSRAGAASAAAPASSASLVNLNTATLAQLESLPGIGKATAERILEYRQKNGNFTKIEELMNVRGIGEKSFLRLKPLITVSAPRAERATQP